jgi:hypothetical protein
MLDALRHDPAGTRFQGFHERLQERHPAMRVVLSIAGALILAIGLALLVLPGPGIPLVVVGLALLAGLSVRLARLLDRSETAVRRKLHRE